MIKAGTSFYNNFGKYFFKRELMPAGGLSIPKRLYWILCFQRVMIKKTLAGLLACGTLSCGYANINSETALHQTPQSEYAIVLIDMQQSFLKNIEQQEVDEEVPYQIEVIQAAQRNNIPVFVLEYRNHGPTIEPLMDAVEHTDYQVIIKSDDNGFNHTNLDELLKQRGVHNLILAGINASACVIRTGYGALESGYDIITSPDIIANVKWDWNFHESESWYRFHGTWIESHDDLVMMMDNL
jgi:nicotinamidase-related amidase